MKINKLIIVLIGVLLCDTVVAWEFNVNITGPRLKPPSQKEIAENNAKKLAEITSTELIGKQNAKLNKYYRECNSSSHTVYRKH